MTLLSSLKFAAVYILLSFVVVHSTAQSPRTSSFSDSSVIPVIDKLVPPEYPPLARSAQIVGDVKLEVAFAPDGTVTSVRSISGHPILLTAAVTSAKQSRFSCQGCNGVAVITYKFTIREQLDRCCCSDSPNKSASQDDRKTHVTQEPGHVIVSGPPNCICPDQCTEELAEKQSQVRSAKCLYLWKCGHKTIHIM